MICDLSYYQGNVDFKKLSKKVDFVILRASIETRKDTKYDEYAGYCEQYGIPYHAYHYLKAPNDAKARMEAKIFANATKEHRPLFYVIDCEYKQIKMGVAKKIVDAFEQALRHYISDDIKVAVYIGHELYRSWNLDYGRYAYVWIPRYGKNNGTIAGSTKPSYPCDLWQYTSTGRIDGVKGNVDLDVLNGDKPLDFFTGKSGGMDMEENDLILEQEGDMPDGWESDVVYVRNKKGKLVEVKVPDDTEGLVEDEND